jgi:hypothetical protein
MAIRRVPAEGRTCTVIVGAQGERCGKPATLAFAREGGTVYAECAEHAQPLPTPSTPTVAPSRTVTLVAPSGATVRTARSNRYFVVAYNPTHAHVIKRTASLETARKARKPGMAIIEVLPDNRQRYL